MKAKLVNAIPAVVIALSLVVTSLGIVLFF